jgi:hypothetical protein
VINVQTRNLEKDTKMLFIFPEKGIEDLYGQIAIFVFGLQQSAVMM